MIAQMKLFKYLFTMLLIGVSSFVFAQSITANFRGFILDSETGEGVPFAMVILKDSKFGGVTDATGLFVISKITPGKYTIRVSSVGYDTLQAEIDLKAGQILNTKYSISKKSTLTRQATISEKAEAKENRSNVSVETITSGQIKAMVAVGGEPDLAQYLQILPGVVSTGDQGGQLYIRGGAPVQNKVLLDGMIIYNPFHSIGLFSVFETEIIRTADVYSAGYNAEFGGRVSAVMDIKTRDGNARTQKRKVSVSPFMAKAVIEGPFKRLGPGKNSPATFVLAGKSSYLSQTSKVLYPWADSAGNGLPFSFNDLYGKISLNGSSGSKMNIFGFNFSDQVKYPSAATIGWNNKGLGVSFLLVPENSPTIMRGNLAYSDYAIKQIEASSNLPRQSGTSSFNAGLNFSNSLGKNEITYGFDILNNTTDFRFTNAAKLLIAKTNYNTELSGFVKGRFVGKKIVFEPGIRHQYYATLREHSFEPRFALKWKISKKFRIKAAGGRYSQNLFSANSDRDVVNLFYGFLSSPAFTDMVSTFNGKEITSQLQKSNHIAGGIELDLSDKLEINSEVFYKQFGQIININRNKIYADNIFNADQPDIYKKDYIIESGKAYGWDCRVKYEGKNLYVWFVYSLTYVKRFDGISEYYPVFDRRHNVNLVSTYRFGKNGNYEASMRWNYGSGFPFTQTQSFYEQIPIGSNGIGGNINTTNGNLGILYGTFNGGRLPDYHRLDASVKRTFTFSKNVMADLTFSISNVYNRQNIFYFDRVNYSRVNQLPILPSLTYTMSF